MNKVDDRAILREIKALVLEVKWEQPYMGNVLERIEALIAAYRHASARPNHDTSKRGEDEK